MQQSGGLLLTPVHTLVATLICESLTHPTDRKVCLSGGLGLENHKCTSRLCHSERSDEGAKSKNLLAKQGFAFIVSA